MLIARDFLSSAQNTLNNRQHEDLISLFIYIAQQPVENLTNTELISKLLFNVLTQLYPENFHTKFLSILHNLKRANGVILTLNTPKYLFEIHVRDKFAFKLLLLISLKYRKYLFVENGTFLSFLRNILQEILDTIFITKPQSMCLLKLIEMILKKREDILTPYLSILVLNSMNRASYSPLIGFKNCAHNVNRIVIRSLPQTIKNYLCNFNNLPIKGIYLNDLLKLSGQQEIRVHFALINKFVLKLFHNNTESRDGSFYYDAVIDICTFEDFIENVWPFYSKHFQHFDEGEFYQSFLKYWIPITVKYYKDDFYTLIADNRNVDIHLKVYTLLEIKRKGYYNKLKFDAHTFNFLKFSKTSSIALKIICAYSKKHTYPDKLELQMVQFFLNSYSDCEFSNDISKNLKQLLSQIFLVCHINLSKSDLELNLYSEFFIFIYKFCLSRLIDESCQISGQLLKIIWDVASGSSSDLITRYKIDRENVYETGGNLYFQKLIKSGFWQNTFMGEILIKQIEHFFTEKLKCCSRLIEVVKERYIEFINFDIDLTRLLDEISQLVCLQSSEKIRSYTDLIVCYKKINMKYDKEDREKIFQIFLLKINTFNTLNIFTCVLILDMFIVFSNYDDDIDVVFLTDKSLNFLEKVFSLDYTNNEKEVKVVESFINNFIEYLMVSKPHWSKFDKEKLLNQLCIIINKSNMKRPVSMAVNVFHQLSSCMEIGHKDREVKLKLLNRTFYSLYYNKQSGKIRRNPETRLVIHALCLSDKNLTKPFLVSSLNFMLEVLANPLSSDSTLASTLHSLEVLVSDNCIHQFTLPFIVDIIEQCISLFNKTSWIVRNANLQLLKSLIERFLGVSLDENLRPKTIEDLFILFPTLVSRFYEILTQPKLNSSSVVVLLFFSESQIRNNALVGQSLLNDIDKFRYIFVHIIKNYSSSDNLGFLAIKAFTSVCTDKEIPQVFSQIVYYIQRNFNPMMKKTVFVNLIQLLRKMYHKYKQSLVKTDEDVISCAFNDLVNYLKPFDCFYFNLLSLKVYTIEDVIGTVLTSLVGEINYKKRIWLNNYLYFIFRGIELDLLPNVLDKILSFEILPEFLQINILSVLVDRSNVTNFPVNEIIKILTSKLVRLPDCNRLLTTAYAKSILLFHEITSDLNLSREFIGKIREDFGTKCIYKIFIYVIALARCDCRGPDDERFLSNCVLKYVHAIGDNDEVLLDLATTIKYLYVCSSINDRYYLIKLIFYLLLNDCTSFEICKLISWLTNSQCSSVLISLVKLLNYSHLSSYVGGKPLATKLLAEFYRFAHNLPDTFEESDTYYLIESDCPLPRQYVKMILLESMEACDIEGKLD